MVKKIIIDTDPGIDDAAAILLALASKEVSVQALTTVYGNGTVDQCTRNALVLLETAGRSDIPVYKGVNVPLMRSVHYGHIVHGEDAFGNVGFADPKSQHKSIHAAQALVNMIMESPGEISLVALGPLTNIALALALEPKIAGNLKELILMGGAVLVSGNASEVASANLYQDPEAAAMVYQSGAPIVQAGLDVCQGVVFSHDEFSRLSASLSEVVALLCHITPPLAEFEGRMYGYSSASYVQFNDLPSMAYCIAPQLFEGASLPARIAVHDEDTRGQTIVDLRIAQSDKIPNAIVLLKVDAGGVKKLFLDGLTKNLI